MRDQGRGNGRNRQRWASLALAFCLAGLASDPLARAQTTGSTTAVVPMRITAPASLTVAQGAGAVAMSVSVSPSDSLPANAFVRIKGLPQGAALSEGYAVAPGTWAVALNALPALQAQLPAMPAGRGEVSVQLVSIDGAVLAETRIALVYEPAPVQAPPPPPPAPPPAAAAAPRAPKLSAEEQQKAERMVAQGDRFLDSGNVSVARQFYGRAAEAGLAVGAFKLAETFDPAELDRIAAQGIVAQPAEARKWYERALALGFREAKERLARLANTN